MITYIALAVALIGLALLAAEALASRVVFPSSYRATTRRIRRGRY